MLPVCRNRKWIVSLDRLKLLYMLLYMAFFYLYILIPFFRWKGEKEAAFYSIIGYIGVALFLAELILRRNALKIPHVWLPLAFFVTTGVSVFLNRDLGMGNSIKGVMWFLIQLFLLGAPDDEINRDSHERHLSVLGDILILLHTVGVIWSFLTLLNGEGRTETIYVNEAWKDCKYGFMEGRLFGVFVDPNYAALLCFAVIGLAIFSLCRRKQHIGAWIVYLAAVFLNLLYVVCSGSRTGFLLLVFVLFLGGIVVAERKIRRSGKRALLVRLIPVAVIILAVGIYYGITLIFRHTAGSSRDVFFAFRYIFRDIRFRIWSAYAELLKKCPFFGTGPRNALRYAKENFDPQFYLNESGIDTHNGFVTLFVNTGFVGGILMTGWILWNWGAVLKAVIRVETEWKSLAALFLTCSALLFGCFTLTSLFFCNQVTDIIFWILFGYSLHFTRQKRSTDINKKGDAV